MGRHLHLNAFINPAGHHEAAWRHPSTQPERIHDADYFHAPPRTPRMPDQAELPGAGLLGSYRAALGWGRGRRLGARTAVGPPLPHEPPPVLPEAERRRDP
jgi:hypothetical protein